MLIALTIITSDKQWRDFSFYSHDLEVGLAVLIQITQDGDTIVEARLIDYEREVRLPLDFLDQLPCANPITQLRHQWELVLALPQTTHTVSKPRQPELLQHWLRMRQHQVDYMQSLLSHMQERMLESPHKRRLLAHYQLTIERCYKSITRLETIAR